MTLTIPLVYRFIRDHRIWFYAATVLGLAGYILFVTANPAQAIQWGNFSGQQFAPPHFFANRLGGITDFQDACNYLTFCRWSDSNGLSSPAIGFADIGAAIGAGMALIGRILFIIASFVMFAIGFLLIQAMEVDLLNQVAVTVDYVFGSVGRAILYGDNTRGPVTGRSVVMFSLVMLGIAIYVLYLGVRRTPAVAIRTAMFSLGILLVFGTMTYQAGKNHSELASRAGSGTSAIGNLDANGTLRDSSQISDPGSWSAFSPGWMIAWASNGAGYLTSLVSSAASSLDNAVQAAAGPSSSFNGGACAAYVDALHEAYNETSAARGLGPGGSGAGEILLKYDTLMQSLYFDPYILAAYGDTQSAANAWCRLAEVQNDQPAGDQIMVSDKAGLYREIFADKGSTTPLVGGGEGGRLGWTAEGSPFAAASLFGPNFASSTSATEATYYWAACIWQPGGGVQINPEWGDASANVLTPPSGRSEYTDEFGQRPANAVLYKDIDDFNPDDTYPLNVFDCMSVLAGTEGADGNGGYIGFDIGSLAQASNADDTMPGIKFWYHEDPESSVFGLFGIGNSSMVGYFNPYATASGNSNALQYYLATQGLNASWSMFVGFLALLFMVVAGKYMLPFILGGIVAQLVSVVGWILLVFVLFAMIVPAVKTRQIGVATITTIGWAFLVNAVFVVALSIMMAMTSLFNSLFYDTESGDLIQLFQIAGSTILAFAVVKMMLKRILGFDFNSIKSATKSAALMSGQSSGMLRESAPGLFRATDAAEGGVISAARAARSRAQTATRSGAVGAGGAARRGFDTLLKRTGGAGAAGAGAAAAGAAAGVRPGAGLTAAGAATGAAGAAVGGALAGAGAAVGAAGGRAGATGGTLGNATLGGEPLCVCKHPLSAHAHAVRQRARVGSGPVAGAPDAPRCTMCGCGGYRQGAAVFDQRLAGMGENMRSQLDRDTHGSSLTDLAVKDPTQSMDPKLVAAIAAGGVARAAGPSRITADQVRERMGLLKLDGRASQGVDPKLDTVLRHATLNNIFAGQRPITTAELERMSSDDRRRYLSGDLDNMSPDSIVGRRWYAAPSGVRGGVRDPWSGLSVPNALVRAGSAGARTPQATTNGIELAGVRRGEDGLWRAESVPTAASLVPSRLDGPPPVGVQQDVWSSWKDLRSWFAANDVQAHTTEIAAWPVERQVQMQDLMSRIPDLHSAVGRSVPLLDDASLQSGALGMSRAAGLAPARLRRSIIPSDDLIARVRGEMESHENSVMAAQRRALEEAAEARIAASAAAAESQIASLERAGELQLNAMMDARVENDHEVNEILSELRSGLSVLPDASAAALNGGATYNDLLALSSAGSVLEGDDTDHHWVRLHDRLEQIQGETAFERERIAEATTGGILAARQRAADDATFFTGELNREVEESVERLVQEESARRQAASSDTVVRDSGISDWFWSRFDPEDEG